METPVSEWKSKYELSQTQNERHERHIATLKKGYENFKKIEANMKQKMRELEQRKTKQLRQHQAEIDHLNSLLGAKGPTSPPLISPPPSADLIQDLVNANEKLKAQVESLQKKAHSSHSTLATSTNFNSSFSPQNQETFETLSPFQKNTDARKKLYEEHEKLTVSISQIEQDLNDSEDREKLAKKQIDSLRQCFIEIVHTLEIRSWKILQPQQKQHKKSWNT